MVKGQEVTLKRQGSYIQHLRAKRNLSILVFANKLKIKPHLLQEIEGGSIEAPDEVIGRLLGLSGVKDSDLYNIFGERWERLGEEGS